jgi:hypothetical protein
LPVFSRAFAASSGLISRLALAMSTVPFMSEAMPVPEPPPLTATATSGRTLRYSSAHACARLTSVSEPLFWSVVRMFFRLLQPGSAASSATAARWRARNIISSPSARPTCSR